MFYDEGKTITACDDEPSLIFEVLKEEHINLIDKMLSKKTFDINVVDEAGNDILTKLLKKGYYDIVLKHMKNKNWNVNHQNNDGDTFAHILATIHYVNVIEIIKELKKNKTFIPNIKNKNNETMLDKSINDKYIYTAAKILEDKRFNNIDIFSFKNLYDAYIKTNRYGSYTKISNLQIIIETLEDKILVPRMQKLISELKNRFDIIKEEFIQNKTNELDHIITALIIEGNA
jgi:hypothetical protein